MGLFVGLKCTLEATAHSSCPPPNNQISHTKNFRALCQQGVGALLFLGLGCEEAQTRHGAFFLTITSHEIASHTLICQRQLSYSEKLSNFPKTPQPC